MRFSYNWLQSFFKKKLPSPEKLADILTLKSFEVEALEKMEKDTVLDIALLPNRAPDCSGHWGLAREIGALLNMKPLPPKAVFNKADFDTKDLIKIQIQNRSDCPRYAVLAIKEIKIGPSPQWLKERLRSLGLQPINNIVDIGNYVMLELGQPLHAFDLDGLAGDDSLPTIVVRRARKGEKILALDQKEYKLDPEILIIADQKESLAIAGIKGGKKAEIKKSTRNIVIESANFKPGLIRQGSKLLDLKTDASWRFERGVDPNLALEAAFRAGFLIQQIAGGKTAGTAIDFYPVKTKARQVVFDLQKASLVLGAKVKLKAALLNFKKLGFGAKNVGAEKIKVIVPTWRRDVKIFEDLLEEASRMEGLNKIPSKISEGFLRPFSQKKIRFERSLKDLLKGLGFSEVYSYSFFGQEDIDKFGLREAAGKLMLELENPLSSSQKYLRPTIILSLLKAARKNLRFFERIKLFEAGKIYYRDPKDGAVEKSMLALVLTKKEKTDNSFYQLKAALKNVFEDLKLDQISFKERKTRKNDIYGSFFHSGKTAQIKIKGESLGAIGIVSILGMKVLDIKNEISLAEIDLEKLFELMPKAISYKAPSSFPSLRRDIALLVPGRARVQEVVKVIQGAGGKILKEVELFDVYEGKEIPLGSKNLAFHLVYHSSKKTLSWAEIEKVHQNVVKAVSQNSKWKIR